MNNLLEQDKSEELERVDLAQKIDNIVFEEISPLLEDARNLDLNIEIVCNTDHYPIVKIYSSHYYIDSTKDYE